MARRPWAERRFIYAIQEDRRGGLIKIGTATDVARRMRDIQKACSQPLKLIGVISVYGPHARFEESSIHRALYEHRLKRDQIKQRGLCGVREWFKPAPFVVFLASSWSPDVETAVTLEPIRNPWLDDDGRLDFEKLRAARSADQATSAAGPAP
jgi:hypothetical protein